MKFNLYTRLFKTFTPALRVPTRRLSFTGLLFRVLPRQSTPSSFKMNEAKIDLMLEMISDLKLRNEKLESEATMTHLDLTHMRHEIDELKQKLATFMAISSLTTSTPSNAAAMAGGGASSAHADQSAVVKTAAAAPMPVAAAPMSTPISTLKITLQKEVDMLTFLPKLNGMTSRSDLMGKNNAGGYIWVNFASTEQATFVYDMLLQLADPAYKVVYKQAKAK